MKRNVIIRIKQCSIDNVKFLCSYGISNHLHKFSKRVLKDPTLENNSFDVDFSHKVHVHFNDFANCIFSQFLL